MRPALLVMAALALLLAGCSGATDSPDTKTMPDGATQGTVSGADGNHAPWLAVDADNLTGNATLVVTFHVAVGDDDGDNVTVQFQAGAGNGTEPVHGATITHAYSVPGRFTATFTATDSRGGFVNKTVDVNVLDGSIVQAMTCHVTVGFQWGVLPVRDGVGGCAFPDSVVRKSALTDDGPSVCELYAQKAAGGDWSRIQQGDHAEAGTRVQAACTVSTNVEYDVTITFTG